jgi:hypothetical protein
VTENTTGHKSDYSTLWYEQVMKKGKKRHWGFTCPQCEKKFSSKSHTRYYLINQFDLQFVAPGKGFSTDYETKFYCSEKCVLNHFDDKGVDPDKAVQKIKELW